MIDKKEVVAKLEKLGLKGDKLKVKEIKKVLNELAMHKGPLTLGKKDLTQGIYPNLTITLKSTNDYSHRVAADFDIIAMEIWFFEDIYNELLNNQEGLHFVHEGKKYKVSEVYETNDSHYYLMATVYI